ncbi:MAG: class I SAM-dependent methyltransferase [Deltaproteobacteria bacterium]|nr:class I SAM-dependent methyltransferase [Deltaproteobacteria bacterium]
MPKPSKYHLAPPPRPAATDRHALYEKAVQDPDFEIELLERCLKKAGRPARRLREDFSGTALLSATWVEGGPERTAVAVDHDPKVHDWARKYRLPALGGAASRLSLVQADVRHGPRGPFDAILALNFSYQAFHTRAALGEYFSHALRALAPGGVLLLDIYGGSLAQQGMVERRRVGGGLTYVWTHWPVEPITHRVRCTIHFERSYGRRLPGAFLYDWRLWTLPEVRDLLEEVGFVDVDVLWDVEPPGVEPRYRSRRHGKNQGTWLAYLAAGRS